MKELTISQIEKLERILNNTKKRRIKLKIIGRISDGTFECFLKWLDDNEAHENRDKVDGGILMPSSVELVRRYGKFGDIK